MQLNNDICSIIAKFININPIYELVDWININDLDWITLSANPNAIELLKNNQEKINWHNLSFNPNNQIFNLIQNNLDKINWKLLSSNK